ncbi:MAG: hypothetical protein ABFS24_13545 [Pseudomonadota bacterium]
MNRPLKQAVRDHFEQRALSKDRLERLELLLRVNELRPAGRRPITRPLITWSVAAAIAALLAVTLLFPPGSMDNVPMTERIALEVARNHIKLKPLDVETDSMDGIRRYFTDLEFVPVESTLLASADLELLGGRYCSIQSVPAAQLRITVPYSKRLQTLYQTEYQKDIFGPLPVVENGNAPVTVNVKGITVLIWVEKGLLFALTNEAGLEPIIPPE